MIRIIIVEDERVIRNGIERHVPWGALGISEVRTAGNAQEAFVLCETFQPDIILSDIKMPGMNGIDLCRKFRETNPESQIIFISGYSDKEYLMAAIQLQAISYVEKPISMQELQDALKRAVESVQKVRRQNDGLLHQLLLSGSDEFGGVLESIRQTEIGKILARGSYFKLLLLRIDPEIGSYGDSLRGFREKLAEQFQIHEMDSFQEVLDQRTFCILLSAEIPFQMDKPQLRAYIETSFGPLNDPSRWYLCVSDTFHHLEELEGVYPRTRELLKTLAYNGWNQIAFEKERFTEYCESVPENQVHAFRNALMEKEQEEAESIVSPIWAKLKRDHVVININTQELCYTLFRAICQVQMAWDSDLDPDAQRDRDLKMIEGMETLDEMYLCIKKRIETVCSQENETDQKYHFTVKKIKEYIQHNYHQPDLSTQMVAEAVYLTPTYISGLFKKKTGSTISQYIVEVRLEKAKELLLDPKLKLYQLAEMVGYKDPNYFARIFKKNTGVLPSEYRERGF